MTEKNTFQLPPHDHMFWARITTDRAPAWAVIILCGVMMIAEIVGGALFRSLALIADGLHMSTCRSAAAGCVGYTYARKYPTIAISRSAPENSATSRDIPAPSFLR